MNRSVVCGNAFVIIVVIGFANRWLTARFELVEAATRTDPTGLARNDVRLPLPAISQVTAAHDQFGTHRSAVHLFPPSRVNAGSTRPRPVGYPSALTDGCRLPMSTDSFGSRE